MHELHYPAGCVTRVEPEPNAGSSVNDGRREVAAIGDRDRDAEQHRLDDRDAKELPTRRVNEQVELAQLDDLLLPENRRGKTGIAKLF